MHAPCLKTCHRSKNIYVLYWKYQIVVLLWCYWSKCITKLKIVCGKVPSILLQNVRKPAEKCSFLRGYRVAACSFTKNKAPSQAYFQFAIRLVSCYGKTRYCYKIDSNCDVPSIDKYDLRRHYVLYKWSVFLVFRRKGISYGPYSTK